MNTCQKIRQQLNKAKLNNVSVVKVNSLSAHDKDELEECGYIITEIKNNKKQILYWIVSE